MTGPGGVGKTRLAIEVTRLIGNELRDGAVLVDLAEVTKPVEVAAAIARTLGVGSTT
jgi:predicted ATPase